MSDETKAKLTPIKTVWINHYGSPSQIDVYKETEKCIWVPRKGWGEWDGERLEKRMNVRTWDTKAGVLAYYVEEAESQVRAYEARLKSAKDSLALKKSALEHELSTPS